MIDEYEAESFLLEDTQTWRIKEVGAYLIPFINQFVIFNPW